MHHLLDLLVLSRPFYDWGEGGESRRPDCLFSNSIDVLQSTLWGLCNQNPVFPHHSAILLILSLPEQHVVHTSI